MTAANLVLEHALARPPSLGTGRLICIDGPSGSGKSTLASAVCRLTEATTVHTDDLCPGWAGLRELPGILSKLLLPLTRGDVGKQPRYDWNLGTQGAELVLEPVPLILLEGVGSGSLRLAELTTTLVWVDGEASVRKARAIARDGDSFRDHWETWAAHEDTYFAAERVRERADLTLKTA